VFFPEILQCQIGDFELERKSIGGIAWRHTRVANFKGLVHWWKSTPNGSLSIGRYAKTLPTEIVTLKNLQQLSLRSNPLVARFARDMTFDPPTLKELAGRAVKLKQIRCDNPAELPTSLMDYLNSAHQCVNPKCKGVYFEARVEHVKFVDFCGKYRVPLLQYLCSPKCSRSPAYAYTDSSSSDADADSGSDDVELDVPSSKLKKVLLG